MSKAIGAPAQSASFGTISCEAAGARGFFAKIRAVLALAALGLALGGCGNCGGWTNPWYKADSPHACHGDPTSQSLPIWAPAE
jgi:hypothetical protein